MNEDQKKIWNYLKENCVGINKAQHVENIAKNLGYPNYGTNNDDIRSCVTSLVMDFDCPIGSCQNGYFIITDETERSKVIDYLTRVSPKIEKLKHIELYRI